MSTMSDAQEVQRMLRLLKQLGDMAEHASLTGSLEGGAKTAVRRYNAILERLVSIGTLPAGVFQPIPDGTGFDELGVECQLLASYLREDGNPESPAMKKPDFQMIVGLAPFLDSKELTEMVLANLPEHGNIDPTAIIALAPFMERSELGRIIRERLPEWFRARAPQAPEPPATPQPPAPPEPPGAHLAPVPPRPAERDEEDTFAEIAAEMQDVARQLGRADLSDEQRAGLAERLARLGEEQARLARQRARLRELPGE